MSQLLNQTATVGNKPGGSGVIAVQAVRQAPADGHTILMGSNSPAVVNAITVKNLPYDPINFPAPRGGVFAASHHSSLRSPIRKNAASGGEFTRSEFKDLRPLFGLAISPVAFAVRADSPHKTVADEVAAARKENRPLQLGNCSAGYQLVAAWLGTTSGLPVTHIPYKGGAQMLTDVIGGALEVSVIDFTGTIALMKGGKLRVLAITAAQRDPGFPAIPTMKESGFPDFETSVWSAFFMRAETPDDVVDKLAAAIQKVMTSEPGKAYHASLPSQPMMMGPKALGEFQRFKRVADTAGIHPE